MTDEQAAALRQELVDVRRENGELRLQIAQLLRMMADQNDRLGEVANILRRREDQLRRVPKPDRPAPDEEPDPPAAPSAGAGEASPRSEKGAGAGPKKRKGGGRKPVAAHLHVEAEHVGVDACDRCGGSHLLARDREVSRKYTVVSYVRCREIVRDVVVCADRDCRHVTTAVMPPMPCPRSLFTCDFLAWLVVQRFVLLVPIDRIRRLLQSQGVDLPMSTLVSLIGLAATLLDPIDGEHWRKLKAGSMILTDGTGMKVLIEGQQKAWDGHLDVFSCGAVVVYLFAMTKHADEFVKLFAGFAGTVVCDAESRIDVLFKDGTRRESNCNAHPRRQFRDSEPVQPRLARKAGQFLLAMYQLEHKAKVRCLTGAALLAWRQRRTRPIVDRFRVWLDTTSAELLPSDPFGKAVRYYRRHFDALTAFVDDASLPIDNNQSERLFQNHAKSRLNSLFAGSLEGAHRYATIAGVVATAQREGLDVTAYLTWVFERRGTHRQRFGLAAADLTPAAFKQTLKQGAREAA